MESNQTLVAGGVSIAECLPGLCSLQADFHSQQPRHLHSAPAHPPTQLHHVPAARQETL